MKKHAAAAGLVAVAVAVVLSAAAAAVAKSAAWTPALLLQRTVPLPASSLETLQNLDKERFSRPRGVPDFDLEGLPGCSNSQSGALQQDGIMGFGKDAPSIMLQLSSQGVSPKAFSHCLTSSDDGGGILVLSEVVEPGFVFTPLVSSQPRYSVNMKSISVNGQNVPIDSSLFASSKTQGTFADSGTSLAYLPDGVYDPIINAIINAAPSSMNYSVIKGNECFICWKSNVSEFPIVTLFFEGGVPLTVGPANYLMRKAVSHLPDNQVILCIGFQSSKRFKGYEHATILGDLVLRDRIFTYDLEKMRMGWVDYNCSLLNKTTLVVASESLRSHTPSYCSLMIAIGVALINSNISALRRVDSYQGRRQEN